MNIILWTKKIIKLKNFFHDKSYIQINAWIIVYHLITSNRCIHIHNTSENQDAHCNQLLQEIYICPCLVSPCLLPAEAITIVSSTTGYVLSTLLIHIHGKCIVDSFEDSSICCINYLLILFQNTISLLSMFLLLSSLLIVPLLLLSSFLLG